MMLRCISALLLAIGWAFPAKATSGQHLAPAASHQHGSAAGHAHSQADKLSGCSADRDIARRWAELAHPGDKRKLEEHTAFLQLVPACAATHVALQSGAWEDPRTWQHQSVPGPGSRVVVPRTVSVRVEGALDGIPLDWARVDGSLSFAPDVNTALAVRTLVVTERGRLTIGSVAEPVRPEAKARLIFLPRADRDRQTDPFDLAGGLISHGIVEMVGARKTAHRPSTTPLRRGMQRLDFAEPLTAWRAGDQILIPGTHVYDDEDEVITLAAISSDGRSVELERPLAADHLAPSGVAIPIGNLTRNIEVGSQEVAPAFARAHVMVMHVQTGSVFDGVRFVGLGRTDTRRAHSFPQIGADGETKPGSDVNTIGRYAVHFHVLSGARLDVSPHLVRNSVVIDSPKFGIVNHGAHLLAEDNVTFRIAGSHLVAENGSEIGAFRRNMAVRSTGSGEQMLESRMSIYDFGHGGHGIWLQSGGVEATDNWSSGHAGAAIFSMGMDFREEGRPVYFDARNTGPSPFADEQGRIPIMDVSFFIARNIVAASGKGLDVWYHKVYSTHRELGVVDGLTVWNVAEEGVALPYSKHVALRKLRLLGSNRGGFPGIGGNDLTGSLTIEGAEIRNFAVGIKVPARGETIVRNASLRNTANIEIPLLIHEGRGVHLDNVAFEADGSGGDDIVMQSSQALFGDLAILFEPDRIDLTDRHGRNQRLFLPFQHPDAVVFQRDGPEAVRGLTAQEIDRQFGLAPGGALAPAHAVRLPRSNALAAASPLPSGPERAASPAAASAEDERAARSRLFEPFPIRLRHFVETVGPTSSKGWTVVPAAAGAGAKALVHANPNPAKFMFRRGLLPLRIHPATWPTATGFTARFSRRSTDISPYATGSGSSMA